MRAEGIEYFGCSFDFGGMEHEKVLCSAKLFADEVMPACNRKRFRRYNSSVNQ